MRQGLLLKMTDQCICGVDMKEYPHLAEICASTLSGRLKNMAAWIDKQPTHVMSMTFKIRQYFCLSGVYKREEQDLKVTAFPLLSLYDHGCVYCGYSFLHQGPLNDVKIKVGKYEAFLCDGCFEKGCQLCPLTFEQRTSNDN